MDLLDPPTSHPGIASVIAMADLYYIRVGKVDGARVVLHCLTGFTADGTNYETSRSIALSVLLDVKTNANDYEYLSGDAHARLLCTCRF